MNETTARTYFIALNVFAGLFIINNTTHLLGVLGSGIIGGAFIGLIITTLTDPVNSAFRKHTKWLLILIAMCVGLSFYAIWVDANLQPEYFFGSGAQYLPLIGIVVALSLSLKKEMRRIIKNLVLIAFAGTAIVELGTYLQWEGIITASAQSIFFLGGNVLIGMILPANYLALRNKPQP